MNTKLLKQKILDLAIRGKLTQQLKSDGTARDLLTQISDERRKTRDERKGTRSKKSGVILSEAQSAKSKDPGAIIPLDKSEAPFEIPANWEWVRLGDVAKKITDGTHHSPVNLETGDFMYVTAKNIKDDGIHLENITYVSSDTHKEIFARCNPEKGDVLLIKDGATTGVVTVNNLEEPFSLLSSVALLKLGSSIESWYLAFVIRSTLFNQMIRSQMKGVGITRVTLKQIESFAFPLPPLAEQQRIVAKIEEAFAEIDAVEKNKELLKTHIKQTRQKILDLAIHGKLVPQNKFDEPASVLLERITRDNPHYEKLTDVPFEIPDSWEWVKLGDVAYIASGSTPSKEAFVDKGVPYLKMYNLRNQQIDFEYKPQYIKREVHEGKLSRSKAKPGDVIMNIVGPPLGKVALVPESLPECNFNQAAVLIRAHYSSNLTNQYIRYFLLQMDEINAVNTKGTAGQENISLTQTQKMRFPLPPLAEQKRIVNKIEELFASLDEISRHLD